MRTPGRRPHRNRTRHATLAWAGTLAAALLAGCASGPGRDGPPRNPPANLQSVPDAEPRAESIRAGGPNKPYVVLGRGYTPLPPDSTLRQSGLASWYGNAFHGRPTASGEPYDMYAMTAAHTTLPLPSYARIRNPANGREVIVRINDRGPFHDGRIVDLSYAAAARLDLLRGVAPVELERITPEDIRTGAWRRGGQAPVYAAAPAPPPSPPPAAVRTAQAPVAVPSALVAPVAASSAVAAPGRASATDLPPLEPAPAPQAAPAAPIAPPAAPADPLLALAAPAPAPSPAPAAAPIGSFTPPAPMAPQPAPAPAAVAGGYWVQLGAFGLRDGALSLRERMQVEVAGLAPSVDVVSEGGLHRVQAGPFATRQAARDAAERIRSQTQAAGLVVERR